MKEEGVLTQFEGSLERRDCVEHKPASARESGLRDPLSLWLEPGPLLRSYNNYYNCSFDFLAQSLVLSMYVKYKSIVLMQLSLSIGSQEVQKTHFKSQSVTSHYLKCFWCLFVFSSQVFYCSLGHYERDSKTIANLLKMPVSDPINFPHPCSMPLS